MAKELYVRHISDRATEEDLRKLFSVCGTVTSVHLVIDPETGKFTGTGFVRMSTDQETRDAIETLDCALLGNRTIMVNEARPMKPGSKPGGNRRGGFGKGGSAGAGKGRPTGTGRGSAAGGDRAASAGTGKGEPAGTGRGGSAGAGRGGPTRAGKGGPTGGSKGGPAGGGRGGSAGRGRK
jgi:hypothetical protein